MGIRDLTLEDVKNYLRVEHDFDDLLIESFMASAEEYVREWTGVGERLNEYQSLTAPFLMIIGSLYENRTSTVENSPEYLRRSVESLMGIHDFNLVPGDEE